MTTKIAKFQYKCRLCGEIEENPCTGEQNALMSLCDPVYGVRIPKPIIGDVPNLLSIHSCEGGHCGVSDLIGYKIYGEE